MSAGPQSVPSPEVHPIALSAAGEFYRQLLSSWKDRVGLLRPEAEEFVDKCLPFKKPSVKAKEIDLNSGNSSSCRLKAFPDRFSDDIAGLIMTLSFWGGCNLWRNGEGLT